MSTDQHPEAKGRAGGRVVVVTGGARGIGRAIVDRFTTEGATVIIGDLTDPGEVDTGLDMTGQREWIPLDVTDELSVQEFAESVATGHGGVDVLVNNAGIMDTRTLANETVADWDHTMAVNLRGPFLMAKHLVPLMDGRTDSAIVNIGSIEGIGANALHASYAASKAGVHGLTRALAVDLGPVGIRCNAVAPGWIDTDLNRNYVDKHPNQAQAATDLASLHPVGRIGDPADVAAAVLWLATPDAGFGPTQIEDAHPNRDFEWWQNITPGRFDTSDFPIGKLASAEPPAPPPNDSSSIKHPRGDFILYSSSNEEADAGLSGAEEKYEADGEIKDVYPPRKKEEFPANDTIQNINRKKNKLGISERQGVSLRRRKHLTNIERIRWNRYRSVITSIPHPQEEAIDPQNPFIVRGDDKLNVYNREASAAGGPDAGGAPIRSDGNSGVKKGWNYFRGTAPINKNEIGHDIISPAKHLKIIIEGGNNIHKIYKHDNELMRDITSSAVVNEANAQQILIDKKPEGFINGNDNTINNKDNNFWNYIYHF